MNIKTVSSVYFIPLPIKRLNEKLVTQWINLANVFSIQINPTIKTALVWFAEEGEVEYTGEAYEVLKSELEHLYLDNTNHRI